MRARGLFLMAALVFSLPVWAGPLSSCSSIAENNAASAELRQDVRTQRVLDRLRTDSTFTVEEAAAELLGADAEVPDEVIGHLRWVIRSGTGSRSKLTLYHLFNALKADGRADVADQYVEGLADVDQRVRVASAAGLGAAPSSKRKAAGEALLDLLSSERDPRLYHVAVASLARVAGSDLKGRYEDLNAVFRQGKPTDIPILQFIACAGSEKSGTNSSGNSGTTGRRRRR